MEEEGIQTWEWVLCIWGPKGMVKSQFMGPQGLKIAFWKQ
jgi:hypothetical protein